MNAEQRKVSDSILKGLYFLTDEAERNGIDKVADVLRLCAGGMREILTCPPPGFVARKNGQGNRAAKPH